MMSRPHLLPVLALTILTWAACPTPGLAQGPPPRDQPDLALDAKARDEALDGLIRAIETQYVLPDVAAKIAEDLRKRREAGEFDAIAGGKQLAAALTERLREVGRDKHLGVDYSYRPVPERPPGARPGPSAEEKARMKPFFARLNYGFTKAERLEGNVGYLEVRGFLPPDLAGETASAAMTFLASSDALIVDLRDNQGGEPSMVAFLTSYLFDEEPVHLNDLVDRPSGLTRQWWTWPGVPGRKFGGSKPVYILTGARSFSAAEEFAYNLQARKRATIVGETTGGGAHDGDHVRVGEHFSAYLPSRRAVNPVTKTNWEGRGVEPDLAVSADLAPKAAHLAALEAILKAERSKTGFDPRMEGQFQGTIDRLKKEVEAAGKAGAN